MCVYLHCLNRVACSKAPRQEDDLDQSRYIANILVTSVTRLSFLWAALQGQDWDELKELTRKNLDQAGRI